LKGKLKGIYKDLLKEYGHQGWWPVSGVADKNSSDDLIQRGYHRKDYSIPKDRSQVFEICAGAVLTQNTSWKNAEAALNNLKQCGILSPKGILSSDSGVLCEAIRPARYFNQKSVYLRAFSDFFINSENSLDPGRDDLLSVKGVGKETADAMLLYAYFKPVFVIDAYTRRMFGFIGMIDPKAPYDIIQEMFQKALKPDIAIYQEYHALIVEHGKYFYSKKPYGKGDYILERYL